jgi:hypothetical protein
MEKEDVVFLMVQVRHLIEGKHNISDYRVTELYCNWMVHTALFSSDGGLLIIKELTNTLVKNWDIGNENLVQDMSNIFGLSNLRTELTKLFKEHSIPTILFDDYENWKNLVGFLIYYLRGKPIYFPSKENIQKQRLIDLIEEIESIEKPADFYIKNVSIIGDKSPFWCIELGGEKDTTKIVGELFIEKDEPSKDVAQTTDSQ